MGKVTNIFRISCESYVQPASQQYFASLVSNLNSKLKLKFIANEKFYFNFLHANKSGRLTNNSFSIRLMKMPLNDFKNKRNYLFYVTCIMSCITSS